jgi:hypothetical protein
MDAASPPEMDLAYTAFKPLRNKLREFTSESLSQFCSLKLHELKGYQPDKVRLCPPWFVLALLKWSILYEDRTHLKRRNATAKDFAQLIHMVHKFARHIQVGCIRFFSQQTASGPAFRRILLRLRRVRLRECFWRRRGLRECLR